MGKYGGQFIPDALKRRLDVLAEAFRTLCRKEGILPALESSHALAWALKVLPALKAGSSASW